MGKFKLRKLDNQIIKKVITSMKQGVNHSPESIGYIMRNKKYSHEINVAVQMFCFNRTYQEAIDLIEEEMRQSHLEAFIETI